MVKVKRVKVIEKGKVKAKEVVKENEMVMISCLMMIVNYLVKMSLRMREVFNLRD